MLVLHFWIIFEGVGPCAADLCAFKVNVAQQLSRLKVDKLWHLLVQYQVFKGSASMSRAEDQKEEAEVGAKECDLDGECEDEKRGGVGLRLFLGCLLREDARDDVNAELAALHQENEADNRQVSEEGASDWHQVQVRYLDRLVDLLDQPGLKEKQGACHAHFSHT